MLGVCAVGIRGCKFAQIKTPTSHMKCGKCRTTALAGCCHSAGMADDNIQIREGHDRIAKRLFAHPDVPWNFVLPSL